jgi:hypothetical protein
MKQMHPLTYVFLAILLFELAAPPSRAASGSWTNHAASEYASGDGTEGQPFEIASAEQLAYLAETANTNAAYSTGKYFVLSTNIDLAAHYWVPVAEFRGHFDGQRNKLLNLTIDSSSANDQGLFGYINSGAEISNLGIVGCAIVGNRDNGALAGRTDTATIRHCYSTGTINGDGGNGGLIGTVSVTGLPFVLSNSWSSCSVTARIQTDSAHSGGLVGPVWSGSAVVRNCYATGAVDGYNNSGGLVALNYNGQLTIGNCYSTGDMATTDTWWNNVGGIMGLGGPGSSTIISNSYASGVITASDGKGKTGGVIGGCDSGSSKSVVNSYYNSVNAAGQGGGTAMSISNMQAAAFVATLNGVQAPAPWLADTNNGNNGVPILTGMPGLHFLPQTGVPTSTLIVSEPVETDFLSQPTMISISGGEYDVDGSNAWTAATGPIEPNVTVRVRTTSADAHNTTTGATVLIGGISGTFSVTTVPIIYTLSYTNGPGGTVGGMLLQNVAEGGDGDEVIAQSDAGAVFDGWSDGVSAASRRDTNVIHHIAAEASFRSAGGVPISWYAQYGISPGDGETWADVDTSDPYGKNMTLHDEFIAVTVPSNPASRFLIVEMRTDSTDKVYVNPSATNREYTLQQRTNLIEGAWTDIPGQTRVPGGLQPLTNAAGIDAARFYRVVVDLP